MPQKTSQSTRFRYGKSFKIINWGCSFDSLLELKYAISIGNEYEFTRARIHIYYDQKTKRPTDYLRTGIKCYTPDFLIRHKHTNQAFLVEIKPDAFSDSKKLADCKEIAENYIRWKGYDWSFIVVRGNEIRLTAEQEKQFSQCYELKSKSAFKLHFEKLTNCFDRSAPTFFKNIPPDSQVRFVMFGNTAV